MAQLNITDFLNYNTVPYAPFCKAAAPESMRPSAPAVRGCIDFRAVRAEFHKISVPRVYKRCIFVVGTSELLVLTRDMFGDTVNLK